MNENNPHIDPHLLVRYLSGHCSEEEAREVHEWLEEDPENEEYLLFIFRILNSPMEESAEWNTAASWNRFKEDHLRQESARPAVAGPRLQPGRTFGRKPASRKSLDSSTRLVLSLMVILMIGIGWFAANFWQHQAGTDPVNEISQESGQFDEITTAPGERMRVSLPDGSSVHLNAASRVRIPWDFSGSGSRVIYLQGEAYFDVEHLEGSDFIVHTDRSETTVLGTTFRVQEYPGEEGSEVAVSSGVVSFRDRNASETSAAIVTANESAELHQSGLVTVSAIQEPSVQFGWMEGELHFHNTGLDDAMKRLERWYDVEIQPDLSDPELFELPVTGQFHEGQTIQEVLEQIALSLEVHFIRQDDGARFTIYR